MFSFAKPDLIGRLTRLAQFTHLSRLATCPACRIWSISAWRRSFIWPDGHRVLFVALVLWPPGTIPPAPVVGVCPWALTGFLGGLLVVAHFGAVPISYSHRTLVRVWLGVLVWRLIFDYFTHNPGGGNWNGWKDLAIALPLLLMIAFGPPTPLSPVAPSPSDQSSSDAADS